MKVEIGGVEYEYFDDIRENDAIRSNFIEFIYKSFGFDFKNWYREGFWTEKYEPHVLVKDENVVSTITVNHMKYLYEGEEKYYIQIGGVLTREAFRKKGLSRWLMNHIMEQYRDKCDQMFLFSDDVAVDFYPKMGFTKAVEYIGSYTWKKENVKTAGEEYSHVRKMDIYDPLDRQILLDCYKQRNPLSVFQSIDCEELVVFYGLEFKKNCYYYFDKLGLVVVAEIEDEMFLNDIYGQPNAAVEDKMNLLNLLVGGILEKDHRTCNEMNIKLGFSPIEELSDIKIEPLIQEDDTTFLIKEKENIFENNKLCFPILSHN